MKGERGMKKTKKDKQEAAGAAAGIATNLAASAAFGTIFHAAPFLRNNNNCPKCKVPISPYLMDNGVLPKNCPYCGAVMNNE